VQGVRRPRESLRVVNLSKELKTIAAGVRRVKRLQHSVRLKGCRKECVQRVLFSKRLSNCGKKLRKDRPLSC
jgi:hypothetical protein